MSEVLAQLEKKGGGVEDFGLESGDILDTHSGQIFQNTVSLVSDFTHCALINCTDCTLFNQSNHSVHTWVSAYKDGVWTIIHTGAVPSQGIDVTAYDYIIATESATSSHTLTYTIS
jgi:hypothetical protein